jgi:hypothetical protein
MGLLIWFKYARLFLARQPRFVKLQGGSEFPISDPAENDVDLFPQMLCNHGMRFSVLQYLRKRRAH